MRLRREKRQEGTVRPVPSDGVRRLAAALLLFFVWVLVCSELLTVGCYLIPLLAIFLYQYMVSTGPDSLLVLLMLWGLPCAFFTGLLLLAHWAMLKAVGRRTKYWLSVLFARRKKPETSEDEKGEKEGK